MNVNVPNYKVDCVTIFRSLVLCFLEVCSSILLLENFDLNESLKNSEVANQSGFEVLKHTPNFLFEILL